MKFLVTFDGKEYEVAKHLEDSGELKHLGYVPTLDGAVRLMRRNVKNNDKILLSFEITE